MAHNHESLSAPAEPDRLTSFITSRGGVVPFDEFMAESLYGKQSYYQNFVNIHTEEQSGDFVTSVSNPLFVELMSRYILQTLDTQGSNSFMELAGGMGTFKRFFLANAAQASADVSYTSVDISEKLIGLQKLQGGTNIRASALTLPFADHSINGIIFMNELVDAFPFKVIRTARKHDRFTGFEELSYRAALGDDNMSAILPEWGPASDAINPYWERQYAYLQPRGFYPDWDFRNQGEMCFNLYEEPFILELGRVMNHGQIILIDYGDTVDRLIEQKNLFGLRMYPQIGHIAPENAYRHAYRADITTNVNFTNLQSVATEIGFQVKWYGQQMRFLWDQVTPEEEKVVVSHELKKDLPAWEPNVNILNNSKNHFQVLVLEK